MCSEKESDIVAALKSADTRCTGWVQIHEEAQRKAELEAAAVQRERQHAAEEAARLAAAAQQRALSMHQIQAQQEAEAKRKYALLDLLHTCCRCSENNQDCLSGEVCPARQFALVTVLRLQNE